MFDLATRRIIGATVLMLTTVVTIGMVWLTEEQRMARFEAMHKAKAIENGALLYEQYCSACHGAEGEGVPGRGPSLNPGVFQHYEQLKAQGYPNSLRNFIKLNIAAGRPVRSTYHSNETYAELMPAWSQDFGGPLRPDQVESLVEFVLNWQTAKPAPAPALAFEAVGSDLTKPLPPGDPQRGQALWNQEVKQASGVAASCKACHGLRPGEVMVGPSMAGMATLAAERIRAPDYKGQAKTPEEYIRESIQQPNAYIVEPEKYAAAPGVSLMPATLVNQMSAQDLADLIAFLLTLK
ncbi:MAG: cytochrome c [Thermoflexus sp.]|jgi:cytochrome c2|nr:cytochrome c [Thermoflexus sp.]